MTDNAEWNKKAAIFFDSFIKSNANGIAFYMAFHYRGIKKDILFNSPFLNVTN
jgi:hypothetical protein